MNSLESAWSTIPNYVVSRLSDAAEQGRVPDWLVRRGIRNLLHNRLGDLNQRRPDEVAEKLRSEVASQPIAVCTHDANDQHYEVPASFFQQVLGPQQKYSCSYWEPNTKTLVEAEENALRVTASHAGLTDGMSILELGCGWGSLSLWMAERYPNSRITSVSNSNSQRRYIESAARDRRISNLDVVTADINVFESIETFDRVVSVEMFEHMRNHDRLMEKIDRWLRPQGQLFVHVFCHATTPYLFDIDGAQNWMGRYFFTGGMMPSDDWLPRCGGPLRVAERWAWNGSHYAKTCRAWLSNLDAASETVQPILAKTYGRPDAKRWFHRWRIFFMACEELFAFNEGQEWYVSHYLFEK
ncbi:SAM-dependent methyltransferase [Allorhodopirellula heiligendammensis]|uniref:Cyclopropane-fatty-acyl-phospholipid synthase n=1 Tax=Allorhodopirellula heiligendammensis TaxID=2714739 RepID=A0A5C6BV56_9BACT|nr:cyclopropane-fatty-acyl-phospholipid synthase family protein [Allorhodopirellula heiligendammensis]TWU15742.1 Cyclopropane-fatty-acyl-phospholipid synthase [Allorhodopirellula heiligendammensis]